MKNLGKILLGIVFLSASASAQITGSQRVYSIEDVLRIAAQNNTSIRLAHAQIQAAGANVTGAFGQFLPSINLNVGYNRQLNEFTTFNANGIILQNRVLFPNSYSAGINAQYSIFDGFAREATYNRTQSDFNAADYEARRVRERVSYDVHRQYIDILRFGQILRTHRENETLAHKQVEQAQARYEVGKVAVGEVYTQETELGNREIAVVNAENELTQSKAVLLATMGLQPGLSVEFLESSFPNNISAGEISEFRSQIGPVEPATSKALARREDFIAAQARVQAARSNMTVARSGYYPSVVANGGWRYSNTEFSNFTDFGNSYLGFSLFMPVFDNFQTNTNIEAARLNLTQRELELTQLEQNVRTQVQLAYNNLDAAEKQLEITQRALRSAEQNAKSFGERYSLGLVSITETLLANNQFITAQINRLNAVYNYLRARIDVQNALGTLRPAE